MSEMEEEGKEGKRTGRESIQMGNVPHSDEGGGDAAARNPDCASWQASLLSQGSQASESSSRKARRRD